MELILMMILLGRVNYFSVTTKDAKYRSLRT